MTKNIHFLRSLLIAVLAFLTLLNPASATAALPGFTYREIHLQFSDADGKLVTNASFYGFCPELNLLWPRRDEEPKHRNDLIWHESFLGKTDTNGTAKATLPPGRWGFFAVGKKVNEEDTIVAAWTDFRVRSTGETVRLQSTATKHWTLCPVAGISLTPQCLYLQPQGFPISIPISPSDDKNSLAIQLTKGSFQLWAMGSGNDAAHDDFITGWGTLTDQFPDGYVIAPGKPALLDCQGGKGKASLFWSLPKNFGLEGELPLRNNSKIWLSPTAFLLAYQRPITTSINGRFYSQYYALHTGQKVILNFESPLFAGVDQSLSKTKLFGQLYLTDLNGHLLSELLDKNNDSIDLGASVLVNGKQIPAKQVREKVGSLESDSDGEPALDTEEHMLFMAKTTSAVLDPANIWTFTGPPGVLPQPQLRELAPVKLTTATFKMDVPPVWNAQQKTFWPRPRCWPPKWTPSQNANARLRSPPFTSNLKRKEPPPVTVERVLTWAQRSFIPMYRCCATASSMKWATATIFTTAACTRPLWKSPTATAPRKSLNNPPNSFSSIA